MESNSGYDLDLDKFENTLVCMYDKDRDVIIYWEPIYKGFRGTCKECPNNWPGLNYRSSNIKSAKQLLVPYRLKLI